MSDFTLDSLLSSLGDSTAETDMEKAASEQEATPSVADQLKETLTKEASDASTNGETDMSVETGNAIANSILAMLDEGIQKEASDGNNVIKETSEMEAQHASRIKTTPREGKSVTEVAKALYAQAPAGADKGDAVDGAPEGNSEAAVAAIPSDIEKAAAVDELMAEGLDFEDAVAMVKAASEELEFEAYEFEKAAAVGDLMAEGIDFEDAVELVKQASEYQEDEYSDLEKAAAVDELMAEGIDFDDAVALVKQASEEMVLCDEYTDLEKAAAVDELMAEDGLTFDEASDLVKEASIGSAIRGAKVAVSRKAGRANRQRVKGVKKALTGKTARAAGVAAGVGGYAGMNVGSISGGIEGNTRSHAKSYRDGMAKSASKIRTAKALIKKNRRKIAAGAGAAAGVAAGAVVGHKAANTMVYGLNASSRNKAQERVNAGK